MSKLDPNRLWAKGWNSDDPVPASACFSGHLNDVYDAAQRVLDATGDDQLLALGLAPSVFRDRLRRCVLLAASIHDIGKANDHFQGMLNGKRNIQQRPQGLRHEWVSILMLKSLKKWLVSATDGKEIDFAIVEWAVAGHHPAHNHASPPTLCPPGAGTELQIQMGHKEFVAVLSWLRDTFASLKNPAIPVCSTVDRSLVGPGNVFAELASWAKEARGTWERQVRKTSDAKFTAVVKNCLIAADIVGSALAKTRLEDSGKWDWVTHAFKQLPKPDDLQFIVDYKLKKAREAGEKGELLEFQQEVANSKVGVTLVKAGCGSGKTLAAYQWAARQHPGRRLYFCYPTTGTATEGFKDYLYPLELGEDGKPKEPGPDLERLLKIEADLFHSRSDIDFDVILGTLADSRSPDADTAAKLEALEAWSTPVVTCTVDTVLGLVQNNKRGLFAWPALAQSAFVFDEIHAFDDRLFGALLRFLRDLPGLPALLMTASLPKPREEALRQMLKQRRNIDLRAIEGPTDLEGLPRYRKARITDNNPLPLIEETIKADGKVLWVCNTVGRVMDAAARAEARRLTPFIYHSRFKYVDRVERHKAVITAFSPQHKGPALAICSQVAEMSLDLKGCTLLVTDRAPVPALIQRLGRLNRQAKKGDRTRPFAVIEPDNHLPYTPADLDAAQVWLGNLPQDNIAQRDLAEKWEQTAENPPEIVPSAWLDGGPSTTVSELREASPGITVIMNQSGDLDHDAVSRYEARVRKVKKDAQKEGRDPTTEEIRPRVDEARLSAVTLPMPPPPKKFNWRSWPNHKGIPIAEPGAITYDRKRGAEWRK